MGIGRELVRIAIEAARRKGSEAVILVGDPNQLPPIGVGRPFADLVSYLETTDAKGDDGSPLGNALARLSVEVRAAAAVAPSGEVSASARRRAAPARGGGRAARAVIAGTGSAVSRKRR